MKKIVLLIVLMLTTITYAQKLKIVSGDLNFLKETEEISVVFDYSELKLMKDNLTEEQFVNKK